MRYVELEPLASGGMGTVTLCVGQGAEGFRRIYARKRIHAELATHPELREMFVQEAKLAAAVRHANVVSVIDVGEDPDGVYLVMEYVEGVSLATMLADQARHEGRLPLQIALRILRDVATGLLAIHSATDEKGRPLEIVHRDISPQNVLVGFDGVARVADFGVAKAAFLSGRTASGVLKGKLGYAAPEQLRFEHVDHRCDLFSFGVVCWETLTSTRLYQGREGARAALSDPPPDLAEERDVPDELAALLFWLLAKEPEARPASAEPVIEAIERLLASLVSEEGALDVRSFVRARFEDSSRARRARIQSKLERLGASIDERISASVDAPHGPPAVDPDQHTPTIVDPPSSRRWVVGLALAVTLLAALGYAWFARGERAAEPRMHESAEPVTVEGDRRESETPFDLEVPTLETGDMSPEGSPNEPDMTERNAATSTRPARAASTEGNPERLPPRRSSSAPNRARGRGIVVDMTTTWDWEN